MFVTCAIPPVGVSIAGPQVVAADDILNLSALVVDPANIVEPVWYRWTCRKASGNPCFQGLDVPDAAGSAFIAPSDSLSPDQYRIEVRADRAFDVDAAMSHEALMAGAM